MSADKRQNIQFGYDVAKHVVQAEAPTPPPPPGTISPFKTITEWLHHLCDTNAPEKRISEFHFSLSESPGNYLISLEGFNTYVISDNVTSRRIDFKPVSHLFFALPQEEFGPLAPEEVRQRVLYELLEFINSVRFQNSFFSKGGAIYAGFRGKIWPN